MSASRGFLNNLSVLLNSLAIWAANDGTGPRLSSYQQAAESRWLQERLNRLEASFECFVDETMDSIKNVLIENVYQHYPASVEAAHDYAGLCVAKWGGQKTEGGLHYMTYKAICRREGGPFSTSGGSHDFNAQLAEPIERFMANRWETCFHRRMPKVL